MMKLKRIVAVAVGAVIGWLPLSSFGEVPADYVQLEYLQSEGSTAATGPYIRLDGFNLSGANVVETKFAFNKSVNEVTQNEALFCNRYKNSGTDAGTFTLFRISQNGQTKGLRFDYKGDSTAGGNNTTACADSQPHVIVCSSAGLTVDGAAVQNPGMGTAYTKAIANPKGLLLFACDPYDAPTGDPNSNFTGGKLYSFSVKNSTSDSTLRLNLVPVQEATGDLRFGLYDTVEPKFYPVTGSFTGVVKVDPSHVHTFGDWTTNAVPNCTTAGERRHTCSECRWTEAETLPALGHTFVGRKCSVCGATAPSTKLVEDLVAKLETVQGVSEVVSSPYATGGDLILKIGDGAAAEYVHVFSAADGASTFAVKGDSADLLGRIMLVGGGGGGGASKKYGTWQFATGGGGGGGGVLEEADVGFYLGQSYTVTVGAGGAAAKQGAASSLTGVDWEYSVLGGGAGGSVSESLAANSGTTGATSGGASGATKVNGGTATLGVPGNGSSYGFGGGKPSVRVVNGLDYEVNGGGGGGAGGAGANGRACGGGTYQSGGAGKETDIFGFEFTVGGGGAAGAETGNAQGQVQTLKGGAGGGGTSMSESYGTVKGTSNAGVDGYGGGGASAWVNGQGRPWGDLFAGERGGSGAVVIRYAVSATPLCRHEWVSTGVIQELACEQDGIEGFRCTKTSCGQTKTVTTPAPGHDYSVLKDDGYKHCSRCDKMEPCDVCTWGDPVEDPLATCVTDGTLTYTCTRCGSTKTEVKKALDHLWSTTATTNSLPTCTVDGIYLKDCTREGCDAIGTNKIAALGHEWGAWTTNVPPKCVETGLRWHTCGRQVESIDGHTELCGFTETNVIEATGHHFVDYRCTACGATENASQLVADLRGQLIAMKGVTEVDASPYAQGGDLILKFADNEYLHVFSDAKEAKSFKVNDDYLLGQTLLVGGGGGAGATGSATWNTCAGGGGAGGGVKQADDVWFYANQNYAVTVGKGGSGSGSTGAAGKTGGTSSLSGQGVNFSVLGGGGGGSGSSGQGKATAGEAQNGGSDGANGGGASGVIPSFVNGLGAASFGVSGKPAGGQAGGEAGYNGDSPTSVHSIWGGGGAGAGGAGAKGQRDISVTSGGKGIAVDIFGTEIRLAGGGAGGICCDLTSTEYRSNGQDGGGSNLQNYYGNKGESAGKSGYGGGGAAGWCSGARGNPVSGLSGGAGVVAIRYRMIGSTPADPLVTFVKCESISETSVRFTYRVRNFGDGSTGAAVIARWGLIPFGATEVRDWTDTQLTGSIPVGQDGFFQLDGLAPGRFYTFKVFARNTAGKMGWAEDVYTIQMPGGRSQWGEFRAAQRADALHTVDFTASIAYVGENTTTVTFRWKQDGDADWSEESLGTFTRDNPPPQTYKLTKTFLAYKPVSYEFVAENAAENPPMEWKEIASGRIAITDGKISESYWATKALNVSPELDASRTKVQSGREVNYYTHAQDPEWGDNWTGRDTFKLCKPKDGDNAGRPLVVGLHGRGGNYDGWADADGVYNAPDDAYAVFFDNDRGEGNNRNHSFPYWWGATSTHFGPELSGVPSYRTERPTAKRVLDCIEWIVREKKIDRNRIYIVGNSMGGQGALAIGLPHGEVFAAIEANVPATIWYASARMNFIDDLGYIRKPADRDGTVYNDPPPVMDWSGSDDVWSRNHEILFEAMNTFRYSYMALWGDYGHCGSYADAQKKNDMVGKYNWRWIEKNKAYPVFCNATDGNQVPAWPWASVLYKVVDVAWPPNGATTISQIGEGTKVTYSPDATLAGQRNAFLRWENVSDDESGVSVNLWIADAADAGTKMFTPPASTKVDVTMRRIQGFSLVPGQTCHWQFGSESGTVTADAEGLATVNVTLTQEKQLFTLAPGAIDAFMVSSEVMETTESAISVIVDVTSLGKGASSAAIALDYKETGAAAWTTKNFTVTKAGAAAYEIAGLEPGKAYDVKVSVNNGKETKLFTFDAVATKRYPLVASVVLGSVATDAINVDVTVDQVGTFATKAIVRAEIRGPNDLDWVVRELGTVTEAQAVRYTIDGLLAGARYAVVVKVENDCETDPDVASDLGTVTTDYAGDKRLVELPLVNDLFFTGSFQKPDVAESDDYTVTANAGGTEIGPYSLTLTLTKPGETRWEGTESQDCVIDYRIVDTVKGLKVPTGTEVYTRHGDLFMVFRPEAASLMSDAANGAGNIAYTTDGTFQLDYDGRADVLLIGGGGPGGMAGTYFTTRPGAGGGAGGFVEMSGVEFTGGMPYKVTVGKGGTPGTNHGAINNAGGDSSLVGGALEIVAKGGGGGGHASSAVGQKTAAMGRFGASSGGSIHFSDNWGAGDDKGDGNNSIGGDVWKTHFIEGQGNRGGRVSSTTVGEMRRVTAGGGGAGEACPEITPTEGTFQPGGAGRVSSITGEAVTYAGGGAGGVWAEVGAAAASAGGEGGGGSAAVAADGTFVVGHGVNGLGGGGAGASCFGGTAGSGQTLGEPGTIGTAGKGGDGVIIVKVLGYVGSSCDHADTKVEIPAVEPGCETPGMTAKVVCHKCSKVLSNCAEIAPLGHDFSRKEKVTVTLGNGTPWTYTRTYCARETCGAESRFSKIQHLKWSKDRRHVMLNAHRGLVSEELRIPENSTGALLYAIEQGCEIVEVDPKPTADHVFVLAHDADMKRQIYGSTPGGVVGSGASMNWYGALENCKLRVSDNVNEDSGYHVCTLEETFQICKDQCYVQMDVNYWTADGRVDQLWNLVKKYGMEEQCIFFFGNFSGGNAPEPDKWSPPADMIFIGDIGNGRGGNGTLNQNMAAPYNDASVGTHPERMGFQSLMDYYDPCNIMTDKSLELRDYLETVGRRNPDWAVDDTDTRRAVKVPWISAKSYVAGHKPKYGIKDTADYEVVEDEGNGDPDHGEFYFILKLKNPTTTRWANQDYTDPRSYRDGIKTVWYFADPIPAETVPAMPTDYVDTTAGVTKYGTDGAVSGLKWTGAARAYEIESELVLIFGGDNLTGSLEVEEGKQPIGRYVLVGGGGPGGMNGNKGGSLPGAGGGAGGMLEGEFDGLETYLNPGKYIVSVGQGGSVIENHGAANGKGKDTTLTAVGADKALLTAFGGGGGGHASTGNNQAAAAMGVSGGSSGGSLAYYNYGCNPSCNDDIWGTTAVRGQGNPGGRMGGYLQDGKGMANTSLGGGGASLEIDEARGVWKAGTPNEWAITKGWGQKFDMVTDGSNMSDYMNKFTGGGEGRMSDITGSEVWYAGGGAGGGVYSADTRQPIYGGKGGGGSTIWTSQQIAGHGVAMLGGGGAGMSFRSATDKFAAGKGGDGVAIFRIKMADATCTHPETNVVVEAQAPNCTNDGWTATLDCAVCGRRLQTSEPVEKLGHNFTVPGERVEPTAEHDGYQIWNCSHTQCGCREFETETLPRLQAQRPTDMPADATAVASGEVEGIAWAGADAAWKIGTDVILVYTNPAAATTFTVASGKQAKARVLAVGGGGAGGSGVVEDNWYAYAGAGGGAGGFVQDDDVLFVGGEYDVNVGAGGQAASARTRGGNGGDSFVALGGADCIRALGGGAGGAGAGLDLSMTTGAGGGCGGGSVWCKGTDEFPNGGPGTEGQGKAGGKAVAGDATHKYTSPAGGGGAGANGGDGRNTPGWLGGVGGEGRDTTITGLWCWYAGGGAGGSLCGGAGDEKVVDGGKGGGGSSLALSTGATSGNGLDGLGGGGAGAAVGGNPYASSAAGCGGSGAIVIRITKIEAGCAHANKVDIGEDRDPSCTEAGSRKGLKCLDCEVVLKAVEVIPALGHDFVEVGRTEPTETELGEVESECTRCHVKEVRPLAIKYGLFRDGETVLWLGDSITDLGYHIRDIYNWYLCHNPGIDVKFVNAGISGERAEEVIKRCVSGGVATVKPENEKFNESVVKGFGTVVLMLGMNDLQYTAYQNGKHPTPDEKANLFNAYTNYMTQVLDYLRDQAGNPRVYLCTPTPFDETAVGSGYSPNAPGFNVELAKAAEWVRNQAYARKYALVEWFDRLNAVNAKWQAIDPAFSIIGTDRIHPSMTGSKGRYVMTDEFLKSQGASKVATDIAIDAAAPKADVADRAAISDIALADNVLTFKVTPEGFPMSVPVSEWDYDNFGMRDFNFEQLKVTGLATGDWTLQISNADGSWTTVGTTFTADQLAEGLQLDFGSLVTPQRAAAGGFVASIEVLGDEAMTTTRNGDPAGVLASHITSQDTLRGQARGIAIERTYRLSNGEVPPPPPPTALLPTDMPEGATAIASGEIAGIAWTDAAASWKLGNGDAVIVFTNVAAGTFTVAAGKTATVDYLAVGGGGAGGAGATTPLAGGGGGAGGFLEGSGLALTAGDYAITVGKGGAASTTERGANGGDSFVALGGVDKFRAVGGGAGGGVNAEVGMTGGSGGGGAVSPAGLGGAATEGQGFAGGAAVDGLRPGGGGGAAEAGFDGQDIDGAWVGGNGGAGKASTINGNSVVYAGGGAGGCGGWADYKQTTGGIGGGGGAIENWGTSISESGTDTLGGGGAGACASANGWYVVCAPGNGGNGVVIIRVTKVTDGGVIPVGPGGKSEPYDTKDAAEADLANGKVVFEPSDDVKKVFEGDSEGMNTYKAKFVLKVVPEGDKWVIAAELTSEAQEELLDSAEEATRQIPLTGIAALKGDDQTGVEVTGCVPGFYYSLFDGSEVTGIKVDANPNNVNVLCGTDGTVTFPEVKKPSEEKGFFSVGAGEAPRN